MSLSGAAQERLHPLYRDFDVPQSLRADFEVAATRWLDPSTRQVAPTPKVSASVLLLREGASGLEVFVQRRVQQMEFAPGMLVYPGGAVDPRDTEGNIDWARISPRRSMDAWAATLQVPASQVRPILSAATRELFEECGVLIAGYGGSSVLSDLSDPTWQRHRDALINRSISFVDLLNAEDLTLRSDLLTPVARWITPESKPRRFDTYFFAATLPPGQQADGRTTEASMSQWVLAAQAVEEHLDGPGTMMTPTQVLAEQVARASSVEDYFAAPRIMTPVLPSPVRVDGRLLTRAPIDARGASATPEAK